MSVNDRAKEIAVEINSGDAMRRFLYLDRRNMGWPTRWTKEDILIDSDGRTTELGRADAEWVK